MTSLKVTAHLIERTSGIVGREFLLDGPLAWAEATRPDSAYPTITREHAPEILLPLEKWEQNGLWGWKNSRAHYQVQAHTMLEIRKKPADAELVRFTKEKKNHHALGPHKARDIAIPIAIIPSISWEIECADEDWLRLLLDRITHLGSHRAIGLGQVTHWEIEPGTPGAWADRPMTLPTRPPYWHYERKSHG